MKMRADRATYAKGVGVLTSCCDAAVVVEIDGRHLWSYYCGGCLRNTHGVPLAVPLTLKESWDWSPGHPSAALSAEAAAAERHAALLRAMLEGAEAARKEEEESAAAVKKGPSIMALLRMIKVCAIEIVKRAWQIVTERITS